MIYFLDFEASSLLPTSFPVEVAWVDMDGNGESHLIRPHPKWLENGCPGWSTESEAIHGISLDTLQRDGTPVEQVAARVAEILFYRGAVAFSDSSWDSRWLRNLLEYGGVPGRIGLYDIREAYNEAFRPLLAIMERSQVGSVARAMLDAAKGLEERDHPTKAHRALADAESLWRTWRNVSDAVAAEVASRKKASK